MIALNGAGSGPALNPQAFQNLMSRSTQVMREKGADLFSLVRDFRDWTKSSS